MKATTSECSKNTLLIADSTNLLTAVSTKLKNSHHSFSTVTKDLQPTLQSLSLFEPWPQSLNDSTETLTKIAKELKETTMLHPPYQPILSLIC